MKLKLSNLSLPGFSRPPKLKLPKFTGLSRLMRGRKMNAATRRAATPDDYIEEPTINLWKAFSVVLILHIVAVGGIYAFSSISARHPASEDSPSSTPQQTVIPGGEGNAETVVNTSTGGMKVHRVKTGETLSKIAASYGVPALEVEEINGLTNGGNLRPGQNLKIPVKPTAATAPIEVPKIAEAKKPADLRPTPSGGPAKDSGEIYVVTKGDTPVRIAKKLRVNYDDLLKLNKIDNPKKLQIGQKLKIPQKR